MGWMDGLIFDGHLVWMLHNVCHIIDLYEFHVWSVYPFHIALKISCIPFPEEDFSSGSAKLA